ncbi:glutathione synthetase-like isoform X2 [Brachionus plicatilis]|uniref:Glutathione synthetase n=1 Tax=Brachionus plicatilis TaxID=10195 RepID=A0A3M7PNF4_BRAPC|nr:glutathione synthetase-like isoform X2 [Brachionus plicatilis]
MSVEYTNGNINGNTNENKNGKTNGNTNGIINGAKYAKLYDSRRFITNNLVNRLEEKLTSSKLEQFKINKIIENAIHWCLVNGFVLVPKSRKQEELMVVTYLPFTLFPTPFNKNHFEQVIDLQPHVNELINKISNNDDFMQKSFKNLTVIDNFLENLWCLYNKAKDEGYNQKINFSILRTDYMLHQGDEDISMKQVEINTIAAGFGYVSTKATMLHREILKWTENFDALKRLPHNEPVVKMAQGFAEAWRLYNVKNSIVLFLVLDIEINIADQRHLEYEIQKQEPLIEVHRCTLAELNKYGHLGEDKTLYFDDKEISIVYFRAGYDPSHFKSQVEWDTLYRIEISKAIKCPNIGTFLAGMKKIQESISIEENLEIFCKSNKNLLKSFFAEFFLLNTSENIEKVLENPENYVLKPQREGGGNNFYNQEIVSILNRIKSIETCLNGNVNGKKIMEDRYNKDFYIVMEYLRPLISHNYIISSKYQQKLYETGKQGTLEKKKITNELGVYGVLVKNGDEIVMNETCGYCLRSKLAEDNEAGVMCGSGALDSVYLVD